MSHIRSVLHGINLDLEIEGDVEIGLKCGGWEQCERDRVNRFLFDIDVIELGGDIGFISCYANKKLSPDKKHIVVEQNKEWSDIIAHHRDINNCNFTIINDTYKSSNGLNLTKIIEKFNIIDYALIMDIEGNETDLILNEFDALQNCKLAIIEFHPGLSLDVEKAYNKLIDNGFKELDRCNCGFWVGVFKNVR